MMSQSRMSAQELSEEEQQHWLGPLWLGLSLYCQQIGSKILQGTKAGRPLAAASLEELIFYIITMYKHLSLAQAGFWLMGLSLQ